jgi:hypothetical protein
MKKLFWGAMICVILVSSASAAGIGIGAYGGPAIPIFQDDQGNGIVFGGKAKLDLIPGFAFEPNINFLTYGDATFDFGSREGSKVTYFGADILFGGAGLPVGPKVYLIGGAGLYSVSRDNDEDYSDFGFNAGLGIELGFGGGIALDVRGKAHFIMFEGASKKFVTVTGGLNYYLGY